MNLSKGEKKMNKKVTTKELCEVYAVSKGEVSLWRKQEGFPFLQLGYKTYRYDLEEVEQYFKNKYKKVGK